MLDILFTQNYYEQMLGMMQISSVLKQHGFSTDVSIGTEEKIIRDVIEKKPRIIGFYCTTGFHHKNLLLASKIKKLSGADIITLFGGPHPTFVPEIIRDNAVDVICRGEGEYPVLELVQALHNGTDYTKILNLSVKHNGIVFENPMRPLCDLDLLPIPDRELYKSIDHIYLSKRQEVMLGRGCPYSCNFCSAEAYRRLYRGIGSYVRIRTVTSVISELSDIKNRYHPTCFFFHDDTFTCDADYSKEFIEKYRKEINLPFSCLLRADLVSDSYIGLLKSAGCYLVAFGVESGDQALRSKVLKKNISDQQILDCAKLLHKHEIPFATFNMVGLPGESLDQVWETVNLNASLKPAWAWFSLYQTLPHTALADYAISEGYAQSVDVASSDANFHENSNLLRNHVEGHQISRLKSCSNIVIKFPMLKGVICRVVIRCPFDAVFNLIEKLMYFVCYYKRLTYNMSILDAVKSAFFIYRHIKEFK